MSGGGVNDDIIFCKIPIFEVAEEITPNSIRRVQLMTREQINKIYGVEIKE